MNKREKVKKPEGSKTHRFLWIGLLIFIALIFACVGFSYRSIRQKLNGVDRWLNTRDHIAYLSGYPDGTFGPDRNMTRAEVAQMLFNLLSSANLL